MVAGTHPDDIELFKYVEDDLPRVRRDEIAAHLATCVACAEQIRLVEAGREALVNSQALELPKPRREAILESLSKQEREDRRGAFSLKAALVIVTVLVAIAAVIGAFVNTNHGASNESSAGGAVAGEASGTGEGLEAAQARDLSASGSADEVAEELRAKGFSANVEKDRVVVRGATRRQVREALADRGPGDVEIVVKNP